MTHPTTRTPAGTPTGGQFAATSHPEAQVALLAPDASAGTCPICRGSGDLCDADTTPCPGCTGTGSVTDDAGWDRVARIDRDCTISCLDCGGHGHGIEDGTRCRTCDGAGTITDYSLAE